MLDLEVVQYLDGEDKYRMTISHNQLIALEQLLSAALTLEVVDADTGLTVVSSSAVKRAINSAKRFNRDKP
jgi:hypothetical protein